MKTNLKSYCYAVEKSSAMSKLNMYYGVRSAMEMLGLDE